jgi:drug/metabolite transporter (DMT)-like permease
VSSITLDVTLVVLLAGLIHAVWNAIAKSFADQWTSFTLLNLGVAVPGLIALPFIGPPRAAAWGYLGASVLCHLSYELFLMSAYRHGSLSRSYPIARGVAPALTTFGGLVLAGEHLGGLALGGVALVVAGITSLALLDRAATSRTAVLWALLTGVAIATYTLIDGFGVRASHAPARYTCALFAIQGSLFVVGALARRREHWLPGVARSALGITGGVLSLVGYGIVLDAQTRAPLGVVSALRETGVIWATVIGVFFFKERGGWRVVVAAAVVLFGVACIALA